MPDERDILKKLLPSLAQTGGVRIGPGDDCAAMEFRPGKLLLAAVDQLAGDIHYYRNSTTPEEAARKLLRRNLSDIAAMGGTPLWALLSVATKGRDSEWILRFCRAAAETGGQYGVAIVGGDISSLAAEGEVASLTILGEVEESTVVTRSGAKEGHLLYATGEFGNSLESGHHLAFEPRLPEGRFLALNNFASAMMDVSDGVLIDALRLSEMSNIGITLDPARIPLRAGATADRALRDGEDYELLFFVPPEKAAELEHLWPFAARLTRIGSAKAGSGVSDPQGNSLTENGSLGYEH